MGLFSTIKSPIVLNDGVYHLLHEVEGGYLAIKDDEKFEDYCPVIHYVSLKQYNKAIKET